MSVVCLDKASGRKIHDLLLFENAEPEPLGNRVNGYGSCSPAIDAERVYIHFGSYGTAALDRATGAVVWQRRDLPCRHFRGPGSSVALYKNTLILTMDGVDSNTSSRSTGRRAKRCGGRIGPPTSAMSRPEERSGATGIFARLTPRPRS